MQETWIWSLGQEDPLEKEMATPLQYSCLGNHKLKTGAHQGHLPSVSAETESCAAIAIDLWLSLKRVEKWGTLCFRELGGTSLFRSVQSLSHVVTPWIEACQASLSITNSCSLLKLMFIELVMPSNHLILCHPLLLPASGSFPMSQFFASGGQSIGVSASASVLPMNIQDWFPLGLTGLISLQSKRLSRVFSNTTVQKHQFFSAQLSL